MNAAAGKDTITLLNSGNYMYSKTKVRAVLIQDDLCKVVSSPKSEVAKEAWRKQDSKAMALITLSVEDSQLLHIASCDTAFEMREKLEKQYASLPETYSGLVTALEGRDEADLTVEYVTGKLLDEYQRRLENSRKGEDGGFAFRISSRNGSQ
ncbi:retrovirus pol polyprotein, partial [Trichuris trichiura]